MSLLIHTHSVLSLFTPIHIPRPQLNPPTVLDEKQAHFLVRFNAADPRNPKNWSCLKKWYITIAASFLILCVTFSSSGPAPILPLMMHELGFSSEIATLIISIFVIGFALGPLLWAPLSERYGRRPVFICSFFGFLIGSALSNNAASILVCRFLGGIFASAPLSNSSAVVVDIWNPRERGVAQAASILAPFAGPGLAPFIGGYMLDSGLSWRWVLWLAPILTGFCWLMIVFTIPETFEPVLLVKIARETRKTTGDQRYYAQMETIPIKTFMDRVETVCGRPFKLLIQEPILVAVTLYTTLVYGCIYLTFEAFPIVYTAAHGLKPGPAGLVYLPMTLGGFFSIFIYVRFINKDYVRMTEVYAPDPVPPEYRLRIAMIAGPMLTISFFWFAWTSYPSVPIWATMASELLLGFSICWIFLALFNYIIDVYLFYAASAMAANSVVRSAVGGSFPLFASQMYTKLGPRWASSLIGFISLALAPIPFVFIKYGPRIRARSKFAPQLPPMKPGA